MRFAIGTFESIVQQVRSVAILQIMSERDGCNQARSLSNSSPPSTAEPLQRPGRLSIGDAQPLAAGQRGLHRRRRSAPPRHHLRLSGTPRATMGILHSCQALVHAVGLAAPGDIRRNCSSIRPRRYQDGSDGEQPTAWPRRSSDGVGHALETIWALIRAPDQRCHLPAATEPARTSSASDTSGWPARRGAGAAAPGHRHRVREAPDRARAYKRGPIDSSTAVHSPI